MDAGDRKKRAAGEASDWFSRLQAGEMERADRQQFVAWLRESHLHIAEMLRIAQIHGSLERFQRWSRIATGPKTDADNVVQFPPAPQGGSQIPQDSDPAPRAPSTSRRRRGHAATLFAFAAMALLVVGTLIMLPRIRGQVIETERGERREVVLADGSLLQIDPQTRLRVKYADAGRRVFLERGRAVFHVAKNPNRPFLVQADDTTVRAVGTAFGVEQRAQGIVVTVAEGKVAVSSASRQSSSSSSSYGEWNRGSPLPSTVQGEGKSAPATRASDVDLSTSHRGRSGVRNTARDGENSRPSSGEGSGSATEVSPTSSREKGQGVMVSEAGEVFLTANQQLMVQDGGVAEPVREVDSARALAWAEGRLIFQNDEVGQAVAEFNRYSPMQLTVTDPVLARKPVSGVFNAAEPEAFIAFLQSVTSVEIVRNRDKSITIGSARDP